MFLAQSFLEERAHVSPQGFMVKQELLAGGHPGASVQAEAATGNQVVDMGMEDEGAAPGVQDPEHAQLRPQSPGVARQILQRFGSDGKEQIQGDLEIRTDKTAQLFGHREGEQEVGHGQEQARLLTLQPGSGIGLAAERTVPVVARMIAVSKGRTVRTLKELAAQCRGAAGQNLLQDLAMPSRHGRAETLPVIRSQLPEQLVHGEALTTVAGGRGAHRSAMNWSRRFWCWVLQRLVRWV